MAASNNPALQQTLALANQCLQRQDFSGAERALASLSILGFSGIPEALNILGIIRTAQGRFAEAVQHLSQASAAAPREPVLAYNLGRAFVGLGQAAEALKAFRAAIRLKPDFVEALFDHAHLLHQTGALDEAERGFRQLLRVMPANVHAKLALGSVLVDAGRPSEAEIPLRRGLEEAADPNLKAQFHLLLSMALRRQRKDEEALAACDQAEVLDARLPGIGVHRVDTLQNLGRYDDALAVLKTLLARTPDDPGLHHAYNDLLYRLDRRDEFLKSYDAAPQSRHLQLGKAFFLVHDKRNAEAYAICAAMAARDPQDQVAAVAAANALSLMERHEEAAVAFDALLARFGGSVDLYRRAAEPALLRGDAQKGAWLCEQALRLSPQDGACLALLSIASRMLEDGRDEAINGYDSLIQTFELEPPQGFSDMASFNAELDAELNRLHPRTREFIGQSLRGGTQTPENLFGMGLPMVEKLQTRISEAIARYIAALPDDSVHPFLSRRMRDFRYAGSWSSRLRDNGFHVNHLHPMGWISSCYYVAVPDAVKDETAQQGWIKFGEPSLQIDLKTPVRRTIQPAAGRLVLFPSYMWHGTIPFHDDAARTTIAFDVVPLA